MHGRFHSDPIEYRATILHALANLVLIQSLSQLEEGDACLRQALLLLLAESREGRDALLQHGLFALVLQRTTAQLHVLVALALQRQRQQLHAIAPVRLFEIAAVILILLPIVLGAGDAIVVACGWGKLSRALVRSSLRIRSRRVRVCLMKLLLLRWLLLRWMLQVPMLLIRRAPMVWQLLWLLLLLLLLRRRTAMVMGHRGGCGRRGGVAVGGRSSDRNRTTPSRKGWEVAAASQPRDTGTECSATDIKRKQSTASQHPVSAASIGLCFSDPSAAGGFSSHFLILLFADLLDFILPTRHHLGNLTMARQLQQLCSKRGR